jgi:hypothetical protein
MRLFKRSFEDLSELPLVELGKVSGGDQVTDTLTCIASCSSTSSKSETLACLQSCKS